MEVKITIVALLSALSYIQSSTSVPSGFVIWYSQSISFSCQDSLQIKRPPYRACISLITLWQICSLSNYSLNTCMPLSLSFKITVRVHRVHLLHSFFPGQIQLHLSIWRSISKSNSFSGDILDLEVFKLAFHRAVTWLFFFFFEVASTHFNNIVFLLSLLQIKSFKHI